jgi:hypothetical protein
LVAFLSALIPSLRGGCAVFFFSEVVFVCVEVVMVGLLVFGDSG